MSIKTTKSSRFSLEEPPIITGLDFSTEEIDRRRRQSPPKLLTLDIELSLRCNLRCKYCYSNAGTPLKNELSLSEFCSTINQASDLGAKIIVIVGGGEPFCYPHLKELLEYIENIGLKSLIFTNLTLIDKKWASFLWDRQIGVVGKLNSFQPQVHDFLTGTVGSFKKAFKSLEHLKAQGYSNQDLERPLLALETVILQPNYSEIPKMWRYCRNNNIIPYFEMITEQGRMKQNKQLLVDPHKVMELFQRLLVIDETEFGYTWIPHAPIVSYNCTRHYFASYLKATGELTPCPGVDIPLGNVRTTPLKDILNCQEIRILRNIEKYIQGQCHNCKHSNRELSCYGCRGQAWQTKNDITAQDPDCCLYIDKI